MQHRLHRGDEGHGQPHHARDPGAGSPHGGRDARLARLRLRRFRGRGRGDPPRRAAGPGERPRRPRPAGRGDGGGVRRTRGHEARGRDRHALVHVSEVEARGCGSAPRRALPRRAGSTTTSSAGWSTWSGPPRRRGQLGGREVDAGLQVVDHCVAGGCWSPRRATPGCVAGSSGTTYRSCRLRARRAAPSRPARRTGTDRSASARGPALTGGRRGWSPRPGTTVEPDRARPRRSWRPHPRPRS